jgi:hypothetical protein
VSRESVRLFCDASLDYNPLHLDDDYVKGNFEKTNSPPAKPWSNSRRREFASCLSIAKSCFARHPKVVMHITLARRLWR